MADVEAGMEEILPVAARSALLDYKPGDVVVTPTGRGWHVVKVREGLEGEEGGGVQYPFGGAIKVGVATRRRFALFVCSVFDGSRVGSPRVFVLGRPGSGCVHLLCHPTAKRSAIHSVGVNVSFCRSFFFHLSFSQNNQKNEPSHT